MSTIIRELEKEVLALPPSSRVRLVERVLESVDDFTAPEIARAWELEIERRMTEIRSGKVIPVPAEKVFARARRKLHEIRLLPSTRRR